MSDTLLESVAARRRVPSAGYALDASALLCLLFREPGAERVEAVLAGARMGTPNLAEVAASWSSAARTAARSSPTSPSSTLRSSRSTVPRPRHRACCGGSTRSAGLSLGDRCCLALAATRGATAVTTDRAWAQLNCGVTVELVR